jgi:fructosamine-3-kinase
MYETNTIRVPQPICYGASGANSFVVFEKLSIGGYGGRSAAEEMGRQLARMHRKTSSNKMFGWDIHNTIGATFQVTSSSRREQFS